MGVAAYSDYPQEASSLPRVGDAFRIDVERIMVLKPDLVLAWRTGNPASVIDRLRTLGLRVEVLEPGGLGDVAEHIREIGRLAGTYESAETAALDYEAGLERLRSRAGHRPTPRVFMQMSAVPLYTVTDTHILGDLISVCGGENVFGPTSGVAPAVSVEAVLAARPDVIIASVEKSALGTDRASSALDRWRAWRDLPAARLHQLFTIDADIVSRATPRLLDGGEVICDLLDNTREAMRCADDPVTCRDKG